MGKKKVENVVFGAALLLALAGVGCGRMSDGAVQGGLMVGVVEGISRNIENVAEGRKTPDNAADLEEPEENVTELGAYRGNGADSEKREGNAREQEESAGDSTELEKPEGSVEEPEESTENTTMLDKDTIKTPEQAGNEAQEPTGKMASYSYDGTVFEYDGTAYDMQERDSMVNAIMDCFPVGEYIVIESHTGPYNARYTIFNTQTQEFEKDIAGTMLTFYNDDIHTAVYACWNDICTYDGTVLAKLDIGQYDIIRDISFSEDHTQLKVSIYENGTDEQQRRVEFLPLPDVPD